MIQQTEARRLSSSRELSLVSSSLPPALQTHSAARLKAKIVRARKLRNKYQDLYRRQKLQSKSSLSRKPDEKLNVRTLRKKQMFNEAITRLRRQLTKVSTHAKAPARISVRKRAKPRTAGYKRRQLQASASTRRGLAKRAA
jgi:hypothetical protein